MSIAWTREFLRIFYWKWVTLLEKIIYIDKEFITLGQFLKVADVIASGGMAKWYLSEYVVFVDDEKENRRGKKLYSGAKVDILEKGTYIIKNKSDSTKEDGQTL